MVYYGPMRSLLCFFVVVSICSCASTQGGSSLQRIGELPESDICPEELSRAIEEARGSNSDGAVIALSQAMRWALDNRELRCTPSVTAQTLWDESLAALVRLRTPSAKLAIVVSLEQTHLPGSLHDRHNATFRAQTEAALRALEETGRHEEEVIDGLLRWYAAGAADCSIELYRARIVSMILASDEESIMSLAEHFPPMSGGDRCTPVWLVADFYRELPEDGRARLVEQIVEQPSSALVRAIEATASMGETMAPITRAIAERGCAVVIERANADPTDHESTIQALEHSIPLCVAAENMTAFTDLRRQVLTWLMENGRADDAWRIVEALPSAEMSPDERVSIAGSVVVERVGRSELSEAIAMMETIVEQVDPGHENLSAARDALRGAILSTAREAVVAGDHNVAGRLLETAERLCGDNSEMRPVRLRVDAATLLTVTEDECPPRQELARLAQRARTLQTDVARSFRNDEELVEASQRTQQAMRAFQRRCAQ